MAEMSHPVFGRYDPELICECTHPRKYHNHMGVSENLIIGTNCNACRCSEFKVSTHQPADLTAPAYSSITIYLDDDIFQELLEKGHIVTIVNLKEVPIKPATYIHVHDHKNGHITAYIDSLNYLKEREAKINMTYAMNLTVATG